MNNTINKFLLAGDKFMPEVHLKQLGFTYSTCGPFTKHKERRGLASMVYKFFNSKVASPDKKTVGSGVNENI